MRLIDADTLEDVATKANEQGFDVTRYEFKRIELVLSEFPTVDAEPVRHGKWIDDKIAFYRQCSECGANVRANLYEVFLDCDIRDLHYCPNCGAKMDLSGEGTERVRLLRRRGDGMKGNIAIEDNGIHIGVMHFPNRKKPCLYVYIEDENCYHEVASFSSEEKADWFLEICEEVFKR